MNLHLNILCDEDLLMLFLPGKVNDIEKKCQKVHVQKGESYYREESTEKETKKNIFLYITTF